MREWVAWNNVYYFFRLIDCSLNTHDANALLLVILGLFVSLENCHSSLSIHSVAMK